MSQWIKEATEQTFEQEVIERSAEVPVVVDFWAAWCGPCRQLGPMLDKLANEFAGRFVLVKVDIDQNQSLAAAFGVQSIPFVAAIKDRHLADQFLGLLPEDQLREWIERLVPSAIDETVREAQAIEQSDPEQAESLYRQALAEQADHAAAKVGLARLLHARGDNDQARSLLDELSARGFLEPEAQQLASQLTLGAGSSADVEAAREAADHAPDDLSRQLELARTLAASGEHTEAMDRCLAVITKDRSGFGEEAKGVMLEILTAIGDQPLASDYRRRLATALY